MEWSTQKYEDKRIAKRAHLTHWHPWFAWFPVRVENNHWVWLERIERKAYFFYHDEKEIYLFNHDLFPVAWFYRKK